MGFLDCFNVMLKKDDIVISPLFPFILKAVACHIAGNRQVFQEWRHVSFGVTTTRELAIRMWSSLVCSSYPVVVAEWPVSIPRSSPRCSREGHAAFT
jgi:hypothetical protein